MFNPQKFALPLSLKHHGNAVANIGIISYSRKFFKRKIRKTTITEITCFENK